MALAYAPDVVHVWGTESYWGLVVVRTPLEFPAVLSLQGVASEIGRVYHGGLTWREQVACTGVKELLRGRTSWQRRSAFLRQASIEAEVLRGFRDVIVNPGWGVAQVRAINPAARCHRCALAVGAVFHGVEAWSRPLHPSIFCSSGYPSPFKGIHVAVRALALLRRRFPGLTLRIAGGLQATGLRQDGYIRWLGHEARRLGVAAAVEWLGPLSQAQVAEELRRASVMIVPSYVETDCLAMQEALVVGTPVVAAYAAGIAGIGRDEDTCLFFAPGDTTMCAHQTARLLADYDLASRVSTAARHAARLHNDLPKMTADLLAVYRTVADDSADRHAWVIGDS